MANNPDNNLVQANNKLHGNWLSYFVIGLIFFALGAAITYFVWPIISPPVSEVITQVEPCPSITEKEVPGKSCEEQISDLKSRLIDANLIPPVFSVFGSVKSIERPEEFVVEYDITQVFSFETGLSTKKILINPDTEIGQYVLKSEERYVEDMKEYSALIEARSEGVDPVNTPEGDGLEFEPLPSRPLAYEIKPLKIEDLKLGDTIYLTAASNFRADEEIETLRIWVIDNLSEDEISYIKGDPYVEPFGDALPLPDSIDFEDKP